MDGQSTQEAWRDFKMNKEYHTSVFREGVQKKEKSMVFCHTTSVNMGSFDNCACENFKFTTSIVSLDLYLLLLV